MLSTELTRFESMFLKTYLISTPIAWGWILLAIALHSPSGAAGLVLFAWLAASFILFGKLTFSLRFREVLLAKLFRQEVRDEREEQMSGAATRHAHFLLCAVLVLLLFVSTLQVNFFRPTQAERAQGKTGMITFGMRYSVTTPHAVERAPGKFNLKELPLSKEALLSLMLLMQLASYHVFFRRKK